MEFNQYCNCLYLRKKGWEISLSSLKSLLYLQSITILNSAEFTGGNTRSRQHVSY